MGDMYRKTIGVDEMGGFPAFVYDGEVVVVEEVAKVEEAVRYLEAYACLGFDTETRPAFRKGEYHAVSLLQLAVHERVYLFRLNKCGFPASLKRLLASDKILKIGVGIRDDIKALQRLSGFVPAAFLDLQTFVEAYGIEEKSFSKLMAIIFQVKISKRQRTSNWELPQLTEQQIRYASTDAWGALKMYCELRRS